jgi:hypothetical protein
MTVDPIGFAQIYWNLHSHAVPDLLFLIPSTTVSLSPRIRRWFHKRVIGYKEGSLINFIVELFVRSGDFYS